MDILFTVALPVFALIFVGYGAGRWRLLTAEGIAGINAFVYAFALPVMLFDKLSATPLSRLLDGSFIAGYVLADLAVYGAAYAVARRLLRTPPAQAAQQAMGGSYGNTGYLGLPIVQAAAGRAAAIPMAMCMTLDMLVLLPLTVALVGMAEGGRGNWRRAVLPAVGGLLSNPLLVGIFLGVAVSAVDMPPPAAVRTFTALLGGAAGPCALFAIGATLAGQAGPGRWGLPRFNGTLPDVGAMTGFKLVVHPLAMWGVLAGVFRVDPLWASAAVLAAALPVASTVYVLAGRYRTYLEPVSSAILVSTAASVVTVSIVLTLLFGSG